MSWEYMKEEIFRLPAPDGLKGGLREGDLSMVPSQIF